MKKLLRNVVLRSLCIMVFGVLLIAFSGEMPRWIVYASGGLFVVLGLIVLGGYFKSRKDKRQSSIYPVVAVGCALFGVIQLLFPDLFFGALRYLLSGIVALLALFQCYSLFVIKKAGVVLHWTFFLLPILGLGAAGMVMFYKGFVENDPRIMILLGVVLLFYALLELWTVVLVKRVPPVQAEEVPELEDQED